MVKELEVAVEAARSAGELLRGSFGAKQTVRHKGEVDIVTEVDERAERVVREVLLGAFPTYGMLAEEGGELSGKDDACWVVDPLDGTINYAHGLPVFSVSIALEKRGETVLGVVHDPMREETYVAERGEGATEGATVNGEPIGVSDTGELIHALLVTGFPYDRDQVPAALDLFGRFTLLTRSMRRLGCAALDLCYVASGRLDGYYERGIRAWDMAAGALIVEEAGGKVTDYRGGKLDLRGREVVASNDLLHPLLLSTIGVD